MLFEKNNFIDDNIDISNIHLNIVILNVIDEYNQAIKNKNKIKCEDLQWTLETDLKNSFENGEFGYSEWKRLEAKFKIW